MASFCSKCGAELSPDTRFCGGCGAPTGFAVSAAAPVGVAPAGQVPAGQAPLLPRHPAELSKSC